MQKRRRPGEKTSPTVPTNPVGYPLDADKRLRARAAFMGQSLGEACHSSRERFPPCVSRMETFVAHTKCDSRPGEIPSDKERELALNIADTQAGKKRNPSWSEMLAEEIDRVVIEDLLERLTVARAARPRAAVQEYAEKYRRMHARLALGTLSEAPY
jgi:hypothetical protein